MAKDTGKAKANDEGERRDEAVEQDQQELSQPAQDIQDQAQRVLSGESVGVNHGPGEGLGPEAQPAAEGETETTSGTRGATSSKGARTSDSGGRS